MIRYCFILSLLASLPTISRADDKPKDDTKARIGVYLENGKTGVFYSETADVKDGEFVKIYIVGRAVIPTSLGADEGLEIAQERAEEVAKTAFVTWLNGKVTVKKTTTSQLIITKEGEEGGKEGDNVREQAKKVEKRTKEFEETATSMVRGLKVVGVEQKAKEKTYTVVYRWDARLIGAVGKVDDKLNKPPVPEVKVDLPKAKTDPNKAIPDKRIIVDE